MGKNARDRSRPDHHRFDDAANGWCYILRKIKKYMGYKSHSGGDAHGKGRSGKRDLMACSVEPTITW